MAACHREIAKVIKPGITTSEIDARVEKFLEKNGAFPEQKDTKVFLTPLAHRSTRWCVMDFPISGRCNPGMSSPLIWW